MYSGYASRFPQQPLCTHLQEAHEEAQPDAAEADVINGHLQARIREGYTPAIREQGTQEVAFPSHLPSDKK